ncbi:TPA: UbiD family decarboxylase, partial [Candidatus Bathyarchaeota archaeon]|nr:UbiD family decarboxylase [Candidatus Bathyarchaeota archaeon]
MSDLRRFLKELELRGELRKIEGLASVDFQISRFIKKFDGEALLFKKVKGFTSKVVAGVCGSRRKICLALKVPESGLHRKILNSLTSPSKPKIVEEAAVKEESEPPKLSKLPILRHYEKDGGRYITSAIIAAKDPEGKENVSIH